MDLNLKSENGLKHDSLLSEEGSLKEFLTVFSNVNSKYLIASWVVRVFATIFKPIRFEHFFPTPGRGLTLYCSGIRIVLRSILGCFTHSTMLFQL